MLFVLERELVMDLERLKLTKTVKGKKGRDKVRPDNDSVRRECKRTLFSALRVLN